ncbi:MAG TPA: hypothetical protein PKK34_05455 [Syntrophorhabdaceae bacterium]|nr:hypothetical protein [Syntrophorhabdaceae bacterium]
MIITRTPFRISFFGGGTDLPAWYEENGGEVLSVAIDKYCYISLRRLPPFFAYKHRIVYSKHETVNEIDEIVHPAVREAFRFMKINEGLEVHHDGDLPAKSGLGSSSSFTVGLLHALYALQGKIVTKRRLALEAIHIEQDLIKENVGSQDQVAVAFGGLNKITFKGRHDIDIVPITINRQRIEELQDHLLLFFTGFTRYADKIEGEKIKQMPMKSVEFERMKRMVDQVIEILNGNGNLIDFGRMLNESWKLKKSLSSLVTTPQINDIYEQAIRHGAVGGKILGAGGGGFILFFIKPEDRNRIIGALAPLLYVPFRFDFLGSQVIFYSESGV